MKKRRWSKRFGDAWKTTRAEEKILGRRGIRKVQVKWTNLANPHIQEYGCNHSMLKSDFQNQPKKTPKKRTQSEISSEPSGVIRSKAAQDLATAMPLHSLLSNKIKGVGSLPNFAGRCRICTEYAYGHCSTCTDYGGARRKVRGSVWFLCVPEASGRHCYAAHMHEQLTGRMPDA